MYSLVSAAVSCSQLQHHKRLPVLAQHLCVSRRKVAWSWGSVHWRTIVSSVQWGTVVVVLLCTLVPYVIIRYHAVSEPHERAFLIYDADISHPMFPNTVKGWMAPVFTFLLLFITVSSTSYLACAMCAECVSVVLLA